jgi:outer membrane protein
MNDRFSQYFGLSLNIPIFSRNENKASVARSEINLRQAELNARQTRYDLLQTIEQVYVDVKAQQARYEAAVEKARSAGISYEYQREQFELGMLNAIDLRQSKNALLNANAELIQARYSALLYRKILDFYRGQPISVGTGNAENISDDR